MKTITSLTFLAVFTCLVAQTPLIMHKRMGGTNQNFNTALAQPNALIRQSNFGLPPTIYVKKAIIDSVIVLNDSAVIVVTSQKLVQEFQWEQYTFSAEDAVFVCNDSMLARSLTYDSTDTWKPGRDTLVNHQVFSAKLTCRDIQNKLANEFNIHQSSQNPIIFIGFDCSENRKNHRQNFLPLWISKLPKNPNTYILFFGLISLMYFFFLNRKRIIEAPNKPVYS